MEVIKLIWESYPMRWQATSPIGLFIITTENNKYIVKFNGQKVNSLDDLDLAKEFTQDFFKKIVTDCLL
jgi:hypothetical protein